MPEEQDARRNGTAAQRADEPSPWWPRALRLLLLLAVMGTAGGVATYWLMNRPKAQRQRPPRRAFPVEAHRVRPGEQRVVVDARGTVEPARRVHLAARVGGEVVEVSDAFVPGGRFAAGQVVLQIDRVDYEIAVRRAEIALAQARLALRQRAADIAQRRSALAKAREALKVEQGACAVAQREYDLLGETVQEADRELVLRQPQLASAKAAVEAAQAAVDGAEAAKAIAAEAVRNAEAVLQEAKLDLERTTVRAPFNGTIESRSVELGAEVSGGQALASFVGTDRYWVRVQAAPADLRHLRVPGFNSEDGSPVRLRHRSAWPAGTHREGVVIGALPGLEERGRLAELLVAVDDPLELARPPGERRALVLGAYMEAQILGRHLAGITRVPRTALREGKQVWVFVPDKGNPKAEPNTKPGETASRRAGGPAGDGVAPGDASGVRAETGTLDIRPVEIAWSTGDAVYVSDGLDAGDLLITSDIAAPVQGMALRRAGGADDGGHADDGATAAGLKADEPAAGAEADATAGPPEAQR